MPIRFVTENTKKPRLGYKFISKWLQRVIEKYGYITGNITYIFCNDEYLIEINREFLKHDYYTDIITFSYSENRYISGDMFISIDRVYENSLLFTEAFSDELLRVIVHGLLHLLGYSDSTEQENEIMRVLENDYLIMYKGITNECSE